MAKPNNILKLFDLIPKRDGIPLLSIMSSKSPPIYIPDRETFDITFWTMQSNHGIPILEMNKSMICDFHKVFVYNIFQDIYFNSPAVFNKNNQICIIPTFSTSELATGDYYNIEIQMEHDNVASISMYTNANRLLYYFGKPTNSVNITDVWRNCLSGITKHTADFAKKRKDFIATNDCTFVFHRCPLLDELDQEITVLRNLEKLGFISGLILNSYDLLRDISNSTGITESKNEFEDLLWQVDAFCSSGIDVKELIQGLVSHGVFYKFHQITETILNYLLDCFEKVEGPKIEVLRICVVVFTKDDPNKISEFIKSKVGLNPEVADRFLSSFKRFSVN